MWNGLRKIGGCLRREINAHRKVGVSETRQLEGSPQTWRVVTCPHNGQNHLRRGEKDLERSGWRLRSLTRVNEGQRAKSEGRTSENEEHVVREQSDKVLLLKSRKADEFIYAQMTPFASEEIDSCQCQQFPSGLVNWICLEQGERRVIWEPFRWMEVDSLKVICCRNWIAESIHRHFPLPRDGWGIAWWVYNVFS